MSEEKKELRRRIVRGFLGAMLIWIGCQLFAAWWIFGSVGASPIPRPYNELWYGLAVSASAFVLWFWYFSRPLSR